MMTWLSSWVGSEVLDTPVIGQACSKQGGEMLRHNTSCVMGMPGHLMHLKCSDKCYIELRSNGD